MNLDELISRLDVLAAESQSEIQRNVEVSAQDGMTMIIQRVSETGQDSLGRQFPGYTPEYERYKRGAVGTAKREGKERRAARKTAKATKEKPVGRYRGFVDFTLTGQMLASIGLEEPRVTDKKVLVVVAGRDEITQKKMDGNDTHRPGWFRLSQRERDMITKGSAERFAAYVRRQLGLQ